MSVNSVNSVSLTADEWVDNLIVFPERCVMYETDTGKFKISDGVQTFDAMGSGVYFSPGSGGGGATDHGALTGLADDDHTQYHNDTRGDARYSLKADTHIQAMRRGVFNGPF